MFQHIVLLRWKFGTPESVIDRIARALDDLSARSTDLLDYRHGPNVGSDGRNWDYGVVASFAGVEAFERFRDDEHHVELIQELIVPWMADRAGIQIGTP